MSLLRRLLPCVTGPALGLYLVRVVAEATRWVWPLPALLGLAAVGAVAGFGLAWFITWQPQVNLVIGYRLYPTPQEVATRQARARALWATLPLWLYVLWPRQDPAVAWAVGLTTLAAWGQMGRFAGLQICRFVNLPIFTFLVGFVLYWLTLSPGLRAADEGEFQLVAARWGVAHPPGYPLYSLLGGIFVRLPVGGDPAWRLNLLSALIAAATLALVSSTARRTTGSALSGVLAALTLGSATTFWATATTASIRPLTAFFTALALYTLAAPASLRPTLLALALGLGVAHHPSLVFFGLVCGVYLSLVDPSLLRQPRRWLRPALILALTQLVWLYLPLRDAAGATLAPGNLTTLRGLSRHVSAQGFSGDMFAFATPEHLPDRLALLPTLLRFQFNPFLLLGASLGALLLLRRDGRRFVLLVGGLALHTFVTITYDAPQTVEYEIPAYVALALLVGEVGSGDWVLGIRDWRHLHCIRSAVQVLGSLKELVVAGVVVAGVFNVVEGWPSFRYLARQEDARQYAGALLEAAPEGALVLSNWNWVTPLWYLQQVEGVRPDVEVEYVAPQGESLAQNWVDAIAQTASERPVIVVRYFEPEYWGLPYRFEPFGPAFRVQAKPSDRLPPGLTPLNVDLGGQIRLIAYALDSPGTANAVPTLRPGQLVALTLAWTPLQTLDGDVALFAHLSRGGRLAGQASDRRHSAGGYRPGQVILDRFLVYPLAGEMPGQVQLTVGAYRPGASRLTTDDGSDHVNLTAFDLRPSVWPPVTSRPRQVPFVGGPTLVGLDWDTTVPGQLRLYLHWQGRSQPATLNTTIRQGENVLAQAQVNIPERGYVSLTYDLPENAGPFVLLADAPAIGPWGLSRHELALPVPRPGERYVPVGGEIVLVNVATDKGAILAPGDGLRYDLRLVATRPLLRDRIVSVSLTGPEYAWRDLSDSVPAMGAVPTFKWIHGSTVFDRHRLVLPADAPDGPVHAQLLIYDHYIQAVLPPLDARLLSQGLSIPLHTWTVNTPDGD
jgi:4-amino-4-deoxy-L-arabinose transferase-like glycosyltransferase